MLSFHSCCQLLHRLFKNEKMLMIYNSSLALANVNTTSIEYYRGNYGIRCSFIYLEINDVAVRMRELNSNTQGVVQ